ncbi:ParA family protein [Lacticaseibacillus paracasei]|jgi:cellulose biosynthesis protein BcsQ|uniref:ParA family protein n=1 Tax=Lacticaseibacillus paracasei TaxID=1597 RepID=UPI003DA33E6B
MVKILTIGNFKGGVGKSTTSSVFTCLLGNADKHVLLIDFDPQGNSSELIEKTFQHSLQQSVSTIEAIENTDLRPAIVNVTSNIDILKADWSLAVLPELIEERFAKKDRLFVLKQLLNRIKENYDFILIDTPPTLSVYTNNAILASDYVLMVLQTQQQAYSSSVKFVQYLQQLQKDYDDSFDLLGIVPYLINKQGPVDQEVINDAEKVFGVAMTTNKIYHRERVKRWGRFGIRSDDTWDQRTLKMYDNVLNELLARVNYKER